MRRSLLIVITLVLSACGASGGETSAVVEAAPQAAPVNTVVQSGTDAIAAAQGSPHILWFWGAN